MATYKHDGLTHNLTIAHTDTQNRMFVAIPAAFTRPGMPDIAEVGPNAVAIGLRGHGFYTCNFGQTVDLPDNVPADAVAAASNGALTLVAQ